MWARDRSRFVAVIVVQLLFRSNLFLLCSRILIYRLPDRLALVLFESDMLHVKQQMSDRDTDSAVFVSTVS